MIWKLPDAAFMQRLAGTFGGLTLVGYLAVMCALAIVLPDPGWDMLAYLAAAMEWNGATPQAAHAAAYAAMETATTPAQYAALVSGDAYRIAQAEDWKAFHSVQPLYAAKMAYIALLAALDPLVGGPLRAICVVHWASVAAFAGVVGWWLHSRCLWATGPLVVAAMIALGVGEAIRSPMPDLTASALIIAGCAAFVSGRRIWPVALFAIAFALRPDTLVLLIAMTMVCVAWRLNWLPFALALAAALVISMLVKNAVGHPGWWAHFYFSTVTIQNTLVGFAPDFSLLSLAKGYARGIVGSLTAFTWIVPLIVAGFVATVATMNGLRLDKRATALLAAMVLTIIGKFVLFPLPDARLYLPFVLVAVLLVLGQVRTTFMRA